MEALRIVQTVCVHNIVLDKKDDLTGSNVQICSALAFELPEHASIGIQFLPIQVLDPDPGRVHLVAQVTPDSCISKEGNCSGKSPNLIVCRENSTVDCASTLLGHNRSPYCLLREGIFNVSLSRRYSYFN
jgi:hypothetical protein